MKIARENRLAPINSSAIIAVESPADNPDLVKKLRAEWPGKKPGEQLREMLLKDYRTRPAFDGPNLDGWYGGSDLQIEATMRLLYYYSKQTVFLVVDRLQSADVSDPGKGVNAWMHREVRNGVRTDEFLKAVIWCKHPDIQKTPAELAKCSTDPEIQKLLKPIDTPQKKP